jgi:diguanylate cyclase (GGDEF)-like protein/PAS domain S-box-containing protein
MRRLAGFVFAYRLRGPYRRLQQSEAALRDTAETLRLALAGSTDGWWDWNLENGQQHYSQRWWTMLGYVPDSLPNDAGLWAFLMHPDDLPDCDRIVYGAIAGDTISYEVEFRMRHADGHYLPILSRGHIGRNAEGVAIRLTGTNMDISARRADEAREANRIHIRTLIATSTDLSTTLEAIMAGLAAEHPVLLCSVMKWQPDGRRLVTAARGRLPEYFCRAVQDLPPDSLRGFAGGATDPDSTTFTSIARAAVWAELAPIAAQAGLRGCWTLPLHAGSGALLGSMVIYRQDDTPNASTAEIKAVRIAVQDAVIAIEREQAEAALRRERDFSVNSLNSLPGIVYLVNRAGKFLRWNNNFELVSGYSTQEIGRMLPTDFVTPKDRAKLVERIIEAFELGHAETENDMLTKAGVVIPYYITGRTVEVEGEHCLIGMGIDISARRRTEELQRASESRYRLLFENNLDGVLQTRPGDALILAANPAACAMFGRTEAELQQCSRGDFADLDDPRLGDLLDRREEFGVARGEITLLRADGSRFEAELATCVYRDIHDQPAGCLVIRDITERKRAEAEMNRLAFFDPLTALPNRRLLMDRIVLALAKTRRNAHVGALLFIDLDHFKNINDARGHAVGDALLQNVAHRLAAMLREEDTVARLGGDEFVVLVATLAAHVDLAARAAMGIAEKIREALSVPFVIDGHAYSTGGSIGVTLLQKGDQAAGEQTADDLLREADTAMYRAKEAGRNRIAFFETIMQSEVEARFALEYELAQALSGGQLSMHLQPQFDAHGSTIGAELLMRWQHPRRGAVSPAVFIPLAEDTGMILRMGDWALREGCKTLVRMRAAGKLVPLSINVSPRQFHQPDFPARVAQILRDAGAPADHLVLEVTEGLLIDNLDDTIARMRELTDLGVRFSIDDFGTGYSSLRYLRRLPLYELKIDRSFVQDLPQNSNDVAIVQSILAMAGHLKLRVIAEGVETTEQADFLVANGCDGLQGYLYARPMPIDQWLVSQTQDSPA